MIIRDVVQFPDTGETIHLRVPHIQQVQRLKLENRVHQRRVLRDCPLLNDDLLDDVILQCSLWDRRSSLIEVKLLTQVMETTTAADGSASTMSTKVY